MSDAYQIIKQNIVEKKYPFLDAESLKKQHLNEKNNLDFAFKNYIIIGIGGSSQGSKAVSSILRNENIFYFDHLSSKQIEKTLLAVDLLSTGFIFISKSGNTSEVLTIFDHLVDELKNKLMRIGLNFEANIEGDKGTTTVDVSRFKTFGKSDDGQDIDNDGISDVKEGGLKLEIKHELLQNGTSKVYAKLI